MQNTVLAVAVVLLVVAKAVLISPFRDNDNIIKHDTVKRTKHWNANHKFGDEKTKRSSANDLEKSKIDDYQNSGINYNNAKQMRKIPKHSTTNINGKENKHVDALNAFRAEYSKRHDTADPRSIMTVDFHQKELTMGDHHDTSGPSSADVSNGRLRKDIFHSNGYPERRLVTREDTGNNLNVIASNMRLKREVGLKCGLLNEKYRKDRKPENLKLHMFSHPKSIVVMSTSRAPSRAVAALLATAIRYRAGYTDVTTEIDNRNLSQLAATVPVYSTRETFTDDSILIHVDAEFIEQQHGPGLPRCVPGSYVCSMAGPRLQVIGTTPSVNVYLYAALKETVDYRDCTDVDQWYFYRNSSALKQCGFYDPPRINQTKRCIPVYIIPEEHNTLQLQSEVIGEEVTFCEFVSNRIELNRLLRVDKISFLFIDYDLGYETENKLRIVRVQIPTRLLPPTSHALRIADQYIFTHFAPKILDILNNTTPEPQHLRNILLKESNLKDINEAACAWALDNSAKFETWTETTEIEPNFVAILCNDSFNLQYFEVLKIMDSRLNDAIKEFKLKISYQTLNCSSVETISSWFTAFKHRTDYKSIAGLAVPGYAAKSAASVAAGTSHTQVIFYDVQPASINWETASIISGSIQLLACSIRHFLKRQNWTRIAIISEISALAESYTAELSADGILIKEEKLDRVNTFSIADKLLSLQKANARVFFINAKAETASIIACEATRLNIINVTKYAWIAREWRSLNTCDMNVQMFTLSYWWHGGEERFLKGLGGNEMLRSSFNEQWKNTSWPILAAPLADALLLMVYRLQAIGLKNTAIYYDLHSSETTRELQFNSNVSIAGVVQNINQSNFVQQNPLSQRNFVQQNPLVFVTLWRGHESKLSAIWRAQSDTNDIQEIALNFEPYYGRAKPKDGRSHCVTTSSGDPFNLDCHDAFWAISILLLIVLLIGLLKWRLVTLAQSKKKERETLMRLLSRCERTAAVLEPYLVDRVDLELYEELGSGHFGRVRFGMLRLHNKPPTPVAAKSLREDAAPAEEAEFLREASTMAVLSHEHIVPLVGVCAHADGPPLLLMEHAFFCDLLKYLRQRRHLAEISEPEIIHTTLQNYKDMSKDLDPEACHVSSRALTRLAQEAAAALDYLSSRHIVHRDVRAANCLVDARRRLKLADFGMARNLDVKPESPLDDPEDSHDYKYICRRRGVFPVPWMAPECLERGEFSHASDVWALGVLILEIVTLGARPYGSWNPLQVLRFVSAGGSPPIPIDATYYTVEVIEMCWSQTPEDRRSARNLCEYFHCYPTALRPALRPVSLEPHSVRDSDTGFDERDNQYWSRAADLRISTL